MKTIDKVEKILFEKYGKSSKYEKTKNTIKVTFPSGVSIDFKPKVMGNRIRVWFSHYGPDIPTDMEKNPHYERMKLNLYSHISEIRKMKEAKKKDKSTIKKVKEIVPSSIHVSSNQNNISFTVSDDKAIEVAKLLKGFK